MTCFDGGTCEKGSHYDDIYTYSGGHCFVIDLFYDNNLACDINILVDSEIEVRSFFLGGKYSGDSITYEGTTFTGEDGPPDGMEIEAGSVFRFTSDSVFSYDGVDICCTEPIPSTQEILELRADEDQIGGVDTAYGNVYLNGHPVCNLGWSDPDANVVCRALGYDKGVVGTHAWDSFGPWIDYKNYILMHVNCNGNETSIWDCTYSVPTRDCTASKIAQASCSNKEEETQVVLIVVLTVCLVIFCAVALFFGHRWRQKKRVESVANRAQKANENL